MKEEMLEKIRANFKKLKDDQDYNKKMLDRIHELEQESVVQEYLNLKASFKLYDDRVKMLSDDELIEISFWGNAFDIEDTNSIYVCLGEFGMRDQGLCKRYMNVENSRDFYLVPVGDSDKFESEHKVVFVSKVDNKSGYFLGSKYSEVQRDFISEAVMTNQERACRKILSKKY